MSLFGSPLKGASGSIFVVYMLHVDIYRLVCNFASPSKGTAPEIGRKVVVIAVSSVSARGATCVPILIRLSLCAFRYRERAADTPALCFGRSGVPPGPGTVSLATCLIPAPAGRYLSITRPLSTFGTTITRVRCRIEAEAASSIRKVMVVAVVPSEREELINARSRSLCYVALFSIAIVWRIHLHSVSGVVAFLTGPRQVSLATLWAPRGRRCGADRSPGRVIGLQCGTVVNADTDYEDPCGVRRRPDGDFLLRGRLRRPHARGPPLGARW